jgi:uncharacterized protein (DUF433 family)
MPVVTVLRMIADGMTTAEILANHPELEVEDIKEAVAFAAEAIDERILPVVEGV